jgi:predicted alpha/beta superfamily hydrolase
MPAVAQVSPAQDNSRPFAIGRIERLYSPVLHEWRTLNIYLPEGYDAQDTTRYPVVYLLDGSADEDFIRVAGAYQFNGFPWVGRVAPSIIVGIANTDRKHDFIFPSQRASDKKLLPSSGGSAAFISFLEKELQPYADAHFKTNRSRTLIGESLGGLLATEILLSKPAVFSQYIIICPSLWWDDGALLRRPVAALNAGISIPTNVYIGVGKEGLTPGEPPHVQEVDANLLAEKLGATKAENLKVYFDYLPAETHATIGHQAVLNALRMFATPPCVESD